jgi:hypothetical protein
VTDGTKAGNAQAKKDYSTKSIMAVDVQTLTLTFPKGGVCAATSTRTLTNATPEGPSSKYRLNTTQPVVSTAPEKKEEK